MLLSGYIIGLSEIVNIIFLCFCTRIRFPEVYIMYPYQHLP